MEDRSQNALAFLAICAVAIAIGVLSMLPHPRTPFLPAWDHIDKAKHVAAFAALVFPAAWLERRTWPAIILGAALYGVLIEILQPLAGRERAPLDFAADLIGIALGLALARGVHRLRSGGHS